MTAESLFERWFVIAMLVLVAAVAMAAAGDERRGERVTRADVATRGGEDAVLLVRAARRQVAAVGDETDVPQTVVHRRNRARVVSAAAPSLTRVLNAIAWVESRHNRHAVSSRGARGVYQLSADVCVWCNVDPLHTPSARRCAARLLRLHMRRFGTLDHALAAYVWGAGNLARYERLRLPWPKRVYAYVQAVKLRAGIASAEAAL